MNRLSRLTHILLHLQSRRVITAQELADRFAITPRSVYRDIRALIDSGVPIIGAAGKGYSLAVGYRIPPVMFTQQEINALLTAQQYFLINADNSASNDLANVVTKVKAIIRYAQQEQAEKLESRVRVFSTEKPNETSLLSSIQLAITNCWVITIQYYSLQTSAYTDRSVEPLAVYLTKGNWIMVAFCRLRNDLREFRMDRILKLSTTHDTFPDRYFTLEDYFQKIRENSR